MLNLFDNMCFRVEGLNFFTFLQMVKVCSAINYLLFCYIWFADACLK